MARDDGTANGEDLSREVPFVRPTRPTRVISVPSLSNAAPRR